MRALFTLAALAACTASSGCVTAAVGAAAGVGLFAVQDRTIGEGIDDATASQRVKTRLMAADYRAFREVDVEVAESVLLLSGVVPTEEHRRAAETIARTVPNLRSVYLELEVGAPSTLAENAQDEWITAQVRTRLFASPAVRGINVNIETFRGAVFLMGLARTDLELRRAAEIASIVPGVRRVVSFMEVRTAPVPYYAAGTITPPAPDFRGTQPAQTAVTADAYQGADAGYGH
ncbi:MAG: BON domain-containing protein [Terricaulis sp.]